MYLMYVDESGDPGLTNSPTTHFGLTGIVVHESRWRDFVNLLVAFKKTMRTVYGLPIRGEIHASVFINSKAFGLQRHIRLAILRNMIDEIAKMQFISVTSVIVDKTTKSNPYNVFSMAWITLFQRFENTLKHGNFPGAHKDDYGIVITDATNGKALLRMVRRMNVINYIPSQIGAPRNLPITRIIEDPHGKDSAETLALQAADVCAYFLTQKYRPNSYIRKSGASLYFDRLAPVLNRRATRTNPFGIVNL